MKTFEELREDRRKFLEEEVERLDFLVNGYNNIDTGIIVTDEIETDDPLDYAIDTGKVLCTDKDFLDQYKLELKHLDLSTLAYISESAQPNWDSKFKNQEIFGMTEEENKEIEGMTPVQIAEYIGGKLKLPIQNRDKTKEDLSNTKPDDIEGDYYTYKTIRQFYSGYSYGQISISDIRNEELLLAAGGLNKEGKKTFN